MLLSHFMLLLSQDYLNLPLSCLHLHCVVVQKYAFVIYRSTSKSWVLLQNITTCSSLLDLHSHYPQTEVAHTDFPNPFFLRTTKLDFSKSENGFDIL